MSRALVLIGLGGNQGNRLAHLQTAARALAAHPALDFVRASRIWESEYVGPCRQDPYLNACVALRTDLGPAALLAECRSLERAAGRDDEVVVPHPRMRDRAFVLEPLCEIAPDLRFPDSGETVAAACAKIRRKPGPWLRPREDLSLMPGDPPFGGEVRGAAMAVHRR